MAELMPATVGMFDEIYSTLLRRHDPTIPREKWRNIFEPSWVVSRGKHAGYVLKEGNRVVAFLGLIFSEREVAGSVEAFANVTSWIAEDGGARGAALLFPLRELRSHTITNLTSTPEAYRIFRRFGFEVLETHYQIIPAVIPRGRKRWRVLEDGDEIAAVLSESDRIVYRDHVPYARQLIADDGAHYCHMVFSVRQFRGLRIAKVHHMGGGTDPNEVLPAIGRYLARKRRILAFDCDDRLLGSPGLRWSVRRKLDVPRLYRSASLEPPQISELYTEMVLLGIS